MTPSPGQTRSIFRALLITCWLSACPGPVWADIQLGQRTRLVFATAAEARAELGKRDAFVERMSPFDRSSRLKTDKPVDEATYLAFAAAQAREWSPDEQSRVSAALEGLKGGLESLDLQFPEEIQLIKTTGLEEGAAAYTRSTAIILPANILASAQPQLESLLCHELFHVLSRHDAQLRDRLYRSIGFQPCAELRLPEGLRQRRITNPDGPIDDHCIKIKPAQSEVEGTEQWAIPILTSTSDTYDPAKGGEFFDYLTFKLILVDRTASDRAQPGGNGTTLPLLVDGRPVLLSPDEAGGFMEQIGRNTRYIIHPDEVLADNFVIVVQGKTGVASPEILARIRAALPGD
jgi:hypothetical protein